MAADAKETSLAAPKGAGRLVSIDALRGFDMFWIMGAEEIAKEAAKVWDWPWLAWLSGQLEHPEWNGFAFYDLIFPTFLFLAGASMSFSFAKRLQRGDTKGDLYRHAIVRGLALVVLGMIYNGLLRFDWPNTRLPSVLGRIGLAYLFAALIVLSTEVRGRILWIVGLLLGYWAALKLIPVPGYGAGDLAPGHTLTDYLDRLLIPGRLYKGVRDPEGLMATVPAIATALAGVVTGDFLKRERPNGAVKVGVMAAAGLACLGVALAWDRVFPINKNLWSSSFTVYCAGWDLLFLSLFYLVIDVWRLRAWAFPFVVIGSNSILIYMAGAFVDFEYTTHKLFDGALRRTGAYEPVLFACAVVLVEWLMLWFLYRRRIFLKV
jgi:predicted acyltransferase